jgi:serine/threonine-protein kinase RsbW
MSQLLSNLQSAKQNNFSLTYHLRNAVCNFLQTHIPRGFEQENFIHKRLKALLNKIKLHIKFLKFKSRSMLRMVKRDHLTVKSDLKVLELVQQWFNQFCQQHLVQVGWSESERSRLTLALAEGFTNAVRHAHRSLPPETTIDIEVCLWMDRLEMRIWDYGKPFNPDAIVEPKPGTLQVGGYGWYLLRRLGDRVVYERGTDGRNCLLIIKYALQGQV